MNQECAQRLTDLLQGRHHGDSTDDLDNGAALTITGPDGTQIFRAPLARHHRSDDDDPHVLWIRPILGGTIAPDGDYVFNLSLSRRRALTWTCATLTGHGDVVLTLPGAQTATIRPAAGAELDDIHRWDEFTLNTLTAEEELALDLLDTDSWYGRFG
jgi:hypothetical protein